MIIPKSKPYAIEDNPEDFITHLEKCSAEGIARPYFHASDVRALCSIVRKLQAEITELTAPIETENLSLLSLLKGVYNRKFTSEETAQITTYNTDGSMAVTDEPKDIQEDRQFLADYARDYATRPADKVPQVLKDRWNQAGKSVADYDKAKADAQSTDEIVEAYRKLFGGKA